MDHRINQSYWVLRIGFGLVAFLAGLDKFFNILANWEAYLSPLVTRLVPLSATSFMHLVGVIEMIAGIVVLTGVTRLGGYVLMIWLIGIALNLVTTGHYFDVAVRDLAMSLGALTLARLAEVRESAGAENRDYARLRTKAA